MKLYSRLVVNNLLKSKNNAAISIIGLAIGFAAIFHIFFVIRFETSYDSQHKNADRIYRISGDIIASENTMTHALIGPLMGPGLKDQFPAVELFTRLFPVKHTVKLEANDNIFEIEEAYIADSSVFNILTFSFIYGNSNQALRNPNEIVINKSLNIKMFGDINSLGKTIIRDGTPLTVTGVIDDSPENSHHKLNTLFSMGDKLTDFSGLSPARISEGYWMPSCYVFVLLHKNTKIESITDNFKPFYEKYMSEFGKALNAQFSPVAIPLKELHFSRKMSYDNPKGNSTYSYIFLIIGIFIALVGFINYSNLLVSQNILQSKNIGIRKINGANQLDIYLQLLLNSTIIIAVALFSSLVLYWLSLSMLNDISLIHITTLPIKTIITLSVIILFLFSFISSLIPFFNQTKKSGLTLILKKKNSQISKGQLNFGKISTIAQLSLSIMLLIAILLIGKQLTFLTKSNMGFDKENVVMLKLNKTICNQESVNSLKQEILRDPNIESVAFSKYSPGDVLSSIAFQIEREGSEITKIVNGMEIDYDYIPLMRMELAEGRNFDRNFNDNNYKSAIINEAFIDFCGFTSPAVGQEIGGSRIVGVLKDVCFNSLRHETEPVVFYLEQQKEGYLNIRIKAGADINLTIEKVQQKWKTFYKNELFSIQFLDNKVEMMYDDDYAKSKLIRLFTIITMLISLMGLFNISLLQSNQRTKEIGIRKVNGAKISEVMAMLNIDFIKWVAIAFVVASPIAYYAMNKWLENFANKTTLSWWIFALAGVLTLGIALLTVSWQSWYAATRNPVEALRSE
ncbi:MAG: ABC transporter permease [Bacteroidales bacterium]|nr:ABC transporter permease [Bacteroidales bacterium]